jgi:hypothetical protein
MLPEQYLLVTIRGGHAQLIFESAIAIPQLEASTSAIAIPHLLNKCCPQPQFFLKSATSSPQLESCTFAIFGIFLPWNPVDSRKKKLKVKNIMQLSL